jgi:hypothetical protein
VASSPTQRSLEYLRKERGLVAEVTEHWVAFRGIDKKTGQPRKGGVRKDLFGWIDILAMDPETGKLIAVQTTSGDNVAARLAKIREWQHLGAFLYEHTGEVHGWAKRGPAGSRKLWTVRVVPVTLG